MRRLTVLLLLLTSTFIFAKDINPILKELDKALQNKDLYVKQKYGKIKALKDNVHNSL
ncbi:hypothetical protein [Flavobacterium sp. 3HN19-14]|uniref:hypothetical protein n=1 Tax=Flavobacterium sp. 3HN19-14 TaxID=3448133 RepID=UPI003EE3FA45